MRFCIPIPCFWGKLPFPEAVKKVAEAGFDAAEIYDWRGLDQDAVRAACEETGVELLSMCTTEFRMTDPQYRTLWLNGLRESCDAARKMGVKRLITQVGPDTGAERAVQHASVSAALKQAVPILEESGVTLMIEPLNVKFDHPGYYLTSSQEAFDLIRETGHPSVRVVYDIYHQQISEGNIIPNLTGNLDLIAHLHAAGHPGRHELQFGESDYRVIFAAAQRAGCAVACGLEYRPTLSPEESLREFRRIYGDLMTKRKRI